MFERRGNFRHSMYECQGCFGYFMSENIGFEGIEFAEGMSQVRQLTNYGKAHTSVISQLSGLISSCLHA